MLYELIYNIVAAGSLYEILNYYSHRLLHIPILYNNIHYVHHHYTVSGSGLSSFYVHPIEFCINTLCIYTPIYFYKLNPYYILSYYILSSIYTHSKLNINGYHAYHHLYRTVNYGSFYIIDYIHNTHYKSNIEKNKLVKKIEYFSI